MSLLCIDPLELSIKQNQVSAYCIVQSKKKHSHTTPGCSRVYRACCLKAGKAWLAEIFLSLASGLRRRVFSFKTVQDFTANPQTEA